MSRKKKCYQCGTPTRPDDMLGAECTPRGRWKDVCQECYHDIVCTCQVCGDTDVMPSDVSDFTLLKAELATTGTRPPGIYRIRSRPFMTSSMLGGGFIHGYDLVFVDRLPKPDHKCEISGHVCAKCAVNYAAKFQAAYGCEIEALKAFDKASWEKERQHTRATILANPDMLRDLECTPDEWSRWADLKELYDLPDMATYHEWLFLEHKGVRVFRCYRGSSSWLALDPDPKYRDGRYGHALIFDASSLPTWYRDCDEHRYEHPVEDRRAVIAAIEQGILTQSGVRKQAA